MSDYVHYHRVRQDNADQEDSPDVDTNSSTLASVSWTTLLSFWLLTVLATALLTYAVTARSGCDEAAATSAAGGDGSSPLTTSSHATSAVNRSPCRALPVIAPTPTPPPSSSPHRAWSGLPSLSLLLRTYSASWMELLQFHFTYLMYWPRTYINSGLVFVLDEERASDRRLGTLLLYAFDGGDRLSTPSRVGVVFEAMPGDGILSDRWRNSIGYCRQQYSNFYADLYTDRDYVGIIDTDAYFMRPPNPEDVFELTTNPATNTSTYRPVIIGYNGDTLWCASAEYMVGRLCAGEFMINFPVTIKRSHFAPMRRHIMAHLNATSFEVAWRRMLTDVGDDMKREYSQFTIMATYLWHYHHDDYAWRINGERNKRHKRLKRLLYDTLNTSAMSASRAYRNMATRMAQYDIPTARYVQHPFKSIGKLVDVYDTLCVASNYLAGDCATHNAEARRRMQLKAWQQWYTDEETDTERLWVSAAYPSVEANSNAVINSMAVNQAGQWRGYEWPLEACEAAGEASGVGGMDELSGCVRDDGSSGKPFIHRPHRVSYNASDGTFHEPDEAQQALAGSSW